MSKAQQRQKMREYREEMRELGYVDTSAMLPADVREFLDKEKRRLGLANRGFVIANIVREHMKSINQEDAATS